MSWHSCVKDIILRIRFMIYLWAPSSAWLSTLANFYLFFASFLSLFWKQLPQIFISLWKPSVEVLPLFLSAINSVSSLTKKIVQLYAPGGKLCFALAKGTRDLTDECDTCFPILTSSIAESIDHDDSVFKMTTVWSRWCGTGGQEVGGDGKSRLLSFHRLLDESPVVSENPAINRQCLGICGQITSPREGHLLQAKGPRVFFLFFFLGPQNLNWLSSWQIVPLKNHFVWHCTP